MNKQKSFCVFYSFVGWILIILMFPKPAFNQGDAVIIPGTGVGVLRLGEPINEILEKIGPTEAMQWRLAQTSEGEGLMWLSLEELGMSLAFDFRTKTLRKILVLTEALLVQNTGIRVGSSEKEIERYFSTTRMYQQREIIPPKTEEKFEIPEGDKKPPIRVLDYPYFGIKFYIKQDDHTVYTIEIYERKALR